MIGALHSTEADARLQNVSDTVHLVERMHREIANLETYMRASSTGTAANILGVALHPKRRLAHSKSVIEEDNRKLLAPSFDPASSMRSQPPAETDGSASAPPAHPPAASTLFRIFDVSTVSLFASKLKNAANVARNDGWELDALQAARINVNRGTIPTTTDALAKRRKESVAQFNTKIAANTHGQENKLEVVAEARVADAPVVQVCATTLPTRMLRALRFVCALPRLAPTALCHCIQCAALALASEGEALASAGNVAEAG
jgi:hypothetical protein